MYFPITIIDNFYDNFNEIKKYALDLDYVKKVKFTMPGVHTKSLSEINPLLFNKCTKKLLSIFYDRKIIQNIKPTAHLRIPYNHLINFPINILR